MRPAVGGAHIGMGTHNALVSFGSGYVELIAADPEQPDPAQPRPFGLDDLDGHRLVAFRGAARRAGNDRCAGRHGNRGRLRARRPGRDEPAHPTGHRARVAPHLPSSDVERNGAARGRPVRHRLGDTPMPNTTAPGGLELVDFVIEHRDAALVGAAHHALGLEAITVRDADTPSLSARLTGSAGTVTLDERLRQAALTSDTGHDTGTRHRRRLSRRSPGNPWRASSSAISSRRRPASGRAGR